MQIQSDEFIDKIMKKWRRSGMSESLFIKSMHPKSGILPQRDAIERILNQGWFGQLKIHGHRAQIHIPARDETPVIVYTRKGSLHTRSLPDKIESELRRVFKPDAGWNTLDSEWLKSEEKIFIFDMLKRSGEILSDLSYGERLNFLPRVYASDCLETLPVMSSVESCLEAMKREEPWIEGLVFRSRNTPGFQDTSIIRCRKR